MSSQVLRFDDLERFVDRYSLGFERGRSSGHFLRVKIPNGMLTSEQFREIGKMAAEYGRGYAEITDRQDIQLHWVRGEDADKVFSRLEQIGFCTDKCGQAYPGARYGDVRNVVGCPVAGVDRDELIDASRIVAEVTRFFTGNREYLDLPRKFKMSISGCALNCASPAVQDLAFVAARHPDGRVGFSLYAGGGVGAGPRLAEPVGVFVAPEDVLDVARSFIELFRDYGTREVKSKARFKFMVQAWGVEKLRIHAEDMLGRRFEDFKARNGIVASFEHVGVNPQKQEGYCYVTVPVKGGILSSDLMLKLAMIADRYGWPEIRLTNFQNLVLVGIEERDISKVIHEVQILGFNLNATPLSWTAVACAGDFCGKAPENVKARIKEIVDYLEIRFGNVLRDMRLRIGCSGCPNGCGRHLVADIGLQAVLVRRSETITPAYNLYLGGADGTKPSLAVLVKTGIEADKVKFCLERILASYFERKRQEESFGDFCRRHTGQELALFIEDASGMERN
jgi:sulfite reductase beta subunit-like hemoprotein